MMKMAIRDSSISYILKPS